MMANDEMRQRRPPKSDHAVWALLYMSQESERAIRSFLISKLGLAVEFVERRMHITVYHSRRRLDGLVSYSERVQIEVHPEYWRFMVLAPGGENPRPDINAAKRKIGIRVQRKAPAYRQILDLRSRFYSLEAPVVAGRRTASGERRSAFGSRHYQPHIALLHARSGIDPDLWKAGESFRASMPVLRFDQFEVRCRSRIEDGSD